MNKVDFMWGPHWKQAYCDKNSSALLASIFSWALNPALTPLNEEVGASWEEVYFFYYTQHPNGKYMASWNENQIIQRHSYFKDEGRFIE